MKNKRKPLIIALISVLAVALIAAGVWFFWLKDYLSAYNAPPVSVNTVASIIGLDTGATPRYSGIVEPQDTYKVEKDETKTVGEVLVKTGDQVQPGDVLFRYDTGDLQISLREAELALEGIANQITTMKNQLATLKSEKAKASKDEQATYTVEIQKLELQIKQQEYESSVKQDEVAKLKEAMENTDVFCEVEGVVKEVNTTPKTDPSGQPAPFISILASGDYRIKGTVSELNLSSLSEGMAVVVSSRVDPDVTWNGTVDTIDREPSSDQTNQMYYYGMDGGEKSSKYNFYVSIGTQEGLILGQHVYIQPDLGGGQETKSGLWLPSVYVDHDNSGSFVWAVDERDRLEKRVVTLGEFDSENSTYEIKSGLTKVDSIAYPSESLRPGMPTTTDVSYQNMPDISGGGTDGSLVGGSTGEDSSMQDWTDGGEMLPDDNAVIPEAGEVDGDPVFQGEDGESGDAGMEGYTE